MPSPSPTSEQKPGSRTTSRPLRLVYLVSHPIQYQAPLLRRIAQEPDIDFHVLFGSDFSMHSYKDEGFGGAEVKWDVPLLAGYSSEFLPALRDLRTTTVTSPLNRGITARLRGSAGAPRADVLWIHGYSTANALHAMIAARSLGIPVLIKSDSWLGDRSRSPAKLAAKHTFFRTLAGLVDGVLTIGTLNARYWQHYFGDDIPQFLMPHAVDNAYFQARSTAAVHTRPALAHELGLQAGRPVILFASKLQTRKRCADLLEAFLRLRSADLPNQPYLVIVGEGEERASLERTVVASGSADVRFCGFRNQSELPRFFDLCDVFVLPAQHEPWGLIVNEVMNAARPVILSSDVGCQPDLVTDGQEGFVYPVGDVDALASCLLRTLAHPETARRMGQQALDRINHWSFEQDVVGLRSALAHVGRRLHLA